MIFIEEIGIPTEGTEVGEGGGGDGALLKQFLLII